MNQDMPASSKPIQDAQLEKRWLLLRGEIDDIFTAKSVPIDQTAQKFEALRSMLRPAVTNKFRNRALQYVESLYAAAALDFPRVQMAQDIGEPDLTSQLRWLYKMFLRRSMLLQSHLRSLEQDVTGQAEN